MTINNCYYEEDGNLSYAPIATTNYIIDPEQQSDHATRKVSYKNSNSLNSSYADDDYEIDAENSNRNSTVSTTIEANPSDTQPSISGDYLFNERFQSLMTKYDAFSTNRDQTTVSFLSDCNSDFTNAVETFGKIIISEKNLPPEQKTIKPINVGGIAGGEKFIHRGILFKYAIDPVVGQNNGSPVYLYGGSSRNDELAMKAAGNELKGFRLVAMSLLPANSTTLVYGSSDGGRTVLDSNETFRESIRTVAEMLNLKPHIVGGTTVYTAGDVEGHLGSDGRLYVVDFGRLYPPEAPGVVEKAGGCISGERSVFYNHLRPELVKMNPIPLCSDAFTAWQKNDPEKLTHSEEVKQATERLVNEIIPKCAQELDSIEKSRSIAVSSVTNLVHRRGINLRHLGLIRQHTKHPVVRMVLLTEMWVRSLKSVIYRILRSSSYNQHIMSSLQAKRIIAEVFSLILRPSSFHTWYWKDTSPKCSKEIASQYEHFDFIEHIPSFKYAVTQKYGPNAISSEENSSILNQQHVMFGTGLRRISQLSCFSIAEDLINNEFLSQKVTEVDIESVEPTIKYTSFIHLCDGLSSLHKGKQLQVTTDRRPYLKMMMDAEKHLSRAWALHPDNETILYNRGLASMALARAILRPEWTPSDVSSEDIAVSIEWLDKAGNSFEDACSLLKNVEKSIPKNDASSETKLSTFQAMHTQSLLEGAHAKMLSAVYETSLYKGLNPHAIKLFEQVAKLYLEVHKTQKIMGRLIQDAFLLHAGVRSVAVPFMCSVDDEFKQTLASDLRDTHVTEISLGSGILYAPQLITASQVDILIELLGHNPITKVNLANCVCLHEKSVLQVIQHFGKTITHLDLSGIQVTEAVMTAIGLHVPNLQTLVMRKLILTWTPKLWNRLGKNSIQAPVTLEEVDLEGNPQLEDEAILTFLKRLVQLKKVNLKNCSINEETIQKIKSSHADLELLHTIGDLGISHPLFVVAN